MGTILVTGASGLIGRALAQFLAAEHEVICLSRSNPELNLPFVQGAFHSPEDLGRLDAHAIDAVCHLAAVTGGCTEAEGMAVNVEGTRQLLRHLVDRNCVKFVLASSIAAIGFRAQRFVPQSVPFPDDHPCLDDTGYGFSKYMVEQVAHYFTRQNDRLDITCIRLAGIRPDGHAGLSQSLDPPIPKAIGPLTVMPVSEACRAFAMVVEAPHRRGSRTVNATWPKTRSRTSVPELLRRWFGNRVDTSYYERDTRQHDSLFCIDKIREDYGFVAGAAT